MSYMEVPLTWEKDSRGDGSTSDGDSRGDGSTSDGGSRGDGSTCERTGRIASAVRGIVRRKLWRGCMVVVVATGSCGLSDRVRRLFYWIQLW
jgi:hypothetical protein